MAGLAAASVERDCRRDQSRTGQRERQGRCLETDIGRTSRDRQANASLSLINFSSARYGINFLNMLIGLGIDGVVPFEVAPPMNVPTAFAPPRIMLPGVLIAPISRRSASCGVSASTRTPDSFPVTV